jgi:hypothetical protein
LTRAGTAFRLADAIRLVEEVVAVPCSILTVRLAGQHLASWRMIAGQRWIRHSNSNLAARLNLFWFFRTHLYLAEAPFSPLQGASIMKHEYRAHVINRHGCVIGRVIIACDNAASAKSRVERLVAIHSLELWEGERKIARFEAVR